MQRSRKRHGNHKLAPSSKKELKKNGDYKDKECREESPTNDQAWYEQTPELLRDAASIPFSHASGTPINYNVGWANFIPDSNNQVTPGIMTLSLIPTLTDVADPEAPAATSPVNIAAMSMYSFVRHANSGSANYTAPNLMMYCLSVAQIYSYLNFLQRVYGTCQLYSHHNRFLPKAVIQAQGIDFDNLISHLADFRYGVNSLINKAASFACPADMTYFRRLAFLFSGIYSEGESIKDQLYMYVPEAFLTLSEVNTKPGWRLKLTPFMGVGKSTNVTGTYTVDDLIDYGNALILPLLQSEDINIMSGDILKAYGQNILGLQTLPEVYTVVPTTDLVVLEQFQNADFMGTTASSDVLTVDVRENPDTNLIASNLSLDISSSNFGKFVAAVRDTHILTTILTNPGPGDVIERTRLMTVYETVADSSISIVSFIGGSEIAMRCTMWSINPTTHAIISIDVPNYLAMGTTVTQKNMSDALNEHCQLENFKFHPRINYFSAGSGATTYSFVNAALDIDNFALIDSNTLRTMNEAAMLSLFRVPSIAKFN